MFKITIPLFPFELNMVLMINIDKGIDVVNGYQENTAIGNQSNGGISNPC